MNSFLPEISFVPQLWSPLGSDLSPHSMEVVPGNASLHYWRYKMKDIFFLLQLERKFKSPAFFEKPSEEASDGTAAGCTAHCVPYLPAVLSPAGCCPAHVCSAWSSFSTGKSLPLEVLRSCRNRNGPWMWAIYLEGRTFSPSPLTLLGTDIFILTVIPYELKDRWDGYYWQWSNWVQRAGSITHPWGV